MLLLSQGFGENINPLEIRRNVRKRYHPTFQGVSNRMTINLNVLGVFIENEISGNLNSTSVISMKRGTSSLRKPKLLKKTAKSKQGKWHNIYPFCFTSFPKKKRDNTRLLDKWDVERSRSGGLRTTPIGKSPSQSADEGCSRRLNNFLCFVMPILGSSSSHALASCPNTAASLQGFIELIKVFNCMEQIIRRYQRVTGTHISKQDNREQRHNELARMRNETHNLQLNLQRNTDDDLSFIQFKEFDELEQQLEHSIKKVKMLEAENEQICHWIQEKQQATTMEQQQQLGIEPKLVIEQFPFSGKEQPSSVLLLATLPSHFYPHCP
ncbi:MADS-box protein FBP24 [Vitis vinifera]|uniref:MADS-box protein FBP24 n=1 Tax=Vitis vinifera TaxID=29760 RepID=A0A438JDZ7_VITVI|nr:MADS-box protein FBP24 [Vitis vinifera]